MKRAPGDSYPGNAAENYEKYFVPAIGEPLARELVEAAALEPGESVLDVACGTGIVARLAATRLGAGSEIAGADLNPAMLEVARASTPASAPIQWYETNAEAMSLPDAGYDVVFCQMGLQFLDDPGAGLQEIRRVLKDSGRALVSLPGPKPRIMAIFGESLAEHISPQVAAFAEVVFSLHDPTTIAAMLRDAGFTSSQVDHDERTLRLPPPVDFLWQYIHSTPLAAPVSAAPQARREALEKDLRERWAEFVDGDDLIMQLQMTTAVARP